MKKLFLAASAAALLSGAAYASPFNFTETLSGGFVVTGSFDGTANGNLITDLSNISVIANGTAYSDNGSLGAISWADFENGASFADAGPAVLSFDGTQNDFFFYNAATNNFFHGRTGEGDGSFNYNIFDFGFGNSDNHMIITPADDQGGGGAVPEPASWALMLCGFGAIGGAMRARRGVAVSFG